MKNIKLVEDLPYKVPPIEYISESLPWHKTEKWEQRNSDTVRRIVIHHTASEAPLYNQGLYHVNSHGWPGLSYHLIISGGRINQVNNLEDVTFHAASNNYDTVAICIHGDLSKREMTSQERELLYAAILTVKSVCTIEQVIGHNEVNATSCPNTSVSKIREDILTIEHQMEQQNSWEAKMTKISQMINQFNYFNSLLKAGKEDGNAVWSANQQMLLYDVMKEKGYV